MFCKDCGNLDRSRKEVLSETEWYRYGCQDRNGGFIVGWIKAENDLKLCGCSGFCEKKEAEQLSFLT